MSRPKCDLCDRPATIHETVVTGDGGIAVRHLCHGHGVRLWAAALPPTASGATAGPRKRFGAWGRGPSPGHA
jgi:hypothetical protein